MNRSLALVALCAAAVVGLAGRARAETVLLVVQPFHGRCFDAAHLAARVQERLPSQPVRVGGPSAGASQSVHVHLDGASLAVQITARNAAGRVIGTERRLLPADGECPTLLDTAALIVVRAATPLRASELPRPVEHGTPNPPAPVDHDRPLPTQSRERPPAPAHPVPTPSPPAPRTPPTAPAADDEPDPFAPAVPSPEGPAPVPPPRPAKPRPAPAARPAVAPPPVAAQPGETPPSVTRAFVPRRRLELDVAASWRFPLDGPPSTPAGELWVGYAWRRIGLSVHGGVDGEWSATTRSTAGDLTTAARRIPLGVELHVDFRVRSGVLRLAAGPLVAVWLAQTTGLPHAASASFVEPGATVRALYRLELASSRVVLSAGVRLDVSFVSNYLVVGGIMDPVARTPFVALSPILAFGTQIF